MEEDFYEEEENIEEECSEVEEACEVNEIPIDEIIDTGTVYLEDDSTLEAVEPYFDKFNEIEDQKEDLIEVLEEGIAENEDETQKELDILDYKQDYYTNMTPFDDTSDDEEINEIPIDEIIDTGTVYPEDDSTFEAVEPYFDKFNEIEDQKEDLIEVLEEGIAENEDEIQKELDILDYKQDYYTNLTPFDDTSDDEEINLLLLKKASDSGGGADSDMVMESNVQVIEEEDDEVDVEEDDNPSVYREDKLRTDERQKQMEEENSEEEKSEDDFLSAFVPYDLRSRSDGR